MHHIPYIFGRKNFKEATKLTPYQKKKYVWKMLYIYVLGYEVCLVFTEALSDGSINFKRDTYFFKLREHIEYALLGLFAHSKLWLP
jgi:hypothetical protein